jgi:hypothetical protein
MAMTNSERVGKAMDDLTDGLRFEDGKIYLLRVVVVE